MGLASVLAESETHASKAVEVVASRSACAREMDTGGHRLAFGIGGVHAIDPKDLADIPSFADKVRSRHASLRAPHARDRRLRADLVLPPLFRTREAKILHAAFRSPAPARHRLTLPGPEHVPSQMSLDQTDDAIDPVDAAGSERTPLTKSRPEVVRESPNNVFSPLSVASEATAPGDNSVDSSFSSENVGGSVTPSPIVRRDADVAASAGDDVEVGVSMSFASTGDGDDDDDSRGWLRRRRVSGAVAPGLSANASLLTSLAPSADEATLHRRVSQLRLALRTAEGALDKTRARFDAAEASRSEAEREAAALRARVWTLEGAEALSGARLHDGSLDLLRGELLNEATEELEEAARATAEAETRARDAVDALRRAEDAAAAVVSAASAEVESLSLEAAQARFRAQAESRDAVAAREARDAADAARAEADAEAAKWRDAGARAETERDAARALATRASSDAEAAREAVETATASEEEAVRHNTWLQQRVRELEEGEGADAGARYGAELRRLREKLAADAAKAADTLAAERAARRELEARLADATRDDDAERGGDAPAAADASAEAELRARVAELEARLAAAAGDEWGDALGLDSDEESSSVKNVADAPALAVATATAETQADDDALEEAHRDVARLREANEDLLARQQHAAAAAAAAASPAAIDAALSRNNAAWATKLAQSELAVTEAEEKSERAARRVAALEAECETAKRDLLEIRTREIAVEDQEAAVAAAAEKARAEAERSASARWEHEVLEAKRAATEARGELKRVVEADSEREREANEAEKEWEEKLTEARRAAALAESRRDEAEATVAEAKEAATRAIVRVEEQKEDEIAEARRVAAVAEAKMAEAEASAAEAKEAEANAAVRVAELERERAEATREIELMREREATAELAAEAGAAFAALEAGEEAKMEAAEALAQARAEALTARGELDALRESLRLSKSRRASESRRRDAPAPRVKHVAPSPTATPHGSVFDEPHASVASPMRPAGVTVVQMMTDDETDTASEAPAEARAERRRDARDGDARVAFAVDPEVFRSLTSSPRGLPRLARVATHPLGPDTRNMAQALAGVRGSSSEEDDVVRMSSEDEGDAASARGRGGAREAREAREGTPEHAPGHRETRRRETRHRARDPSPPRVSFDASEGASLASEAFAAVAASAREATAAAKQSRRRRADASGGAPDVAPKPSPAKLAAAALAAAPYRRDRGGDAATRAMRASRVSSASTTTATPPRRRAAATVTSRARTLTDTWGRPTGTWGHPSPTGIRSTAVTGRDAKLPPDAMYLNHRYA